MARPRKSRSFTVSRPPPSKPRQPVKRTKTYTGCWSCRARGIKCDELRPACQKCLQSDICCEGYHVKLVWDDEKGENGRPVKRRTFLTGQEAECPVLSSRKIRLALEKVEASGSPLTVQAGPFTVFPVSQPEGSGAIFATSKETVHSGVQAPGCVTPSLLGYDEDRIKRQLDDGNEESAECWLDGAVDHVDNDETEAAMAMMSIRQKLLPQVTLYVSSASLEERSLFRYWITFLSGLMIPTQRFDNPFRAIFIPLALTASSSTRSSFGSAALLHAIYAISAFNRAQLSSSTEHFVALGTKHHRISLGHLRKSLTQPEGGQRDAILATIITMSSIEVIKGDSGTWRTHLAGGKIWLQSMMKKGCIQSSSFSLLCQIFFCIDALGVPAFAHQTLRIPLEDPPDPPSEVPWSVWGTGYSLDKFFGITKPVLEGIVRTNTLSDPTYHATKEEIDELDFHIRRNDPDVLISDLDGGYDEITRHHTCAFFCASLIYFERRVRKTSPNKIQRLVQRSLDHLDAVRALESEMNLDVCGLFWPEFVTACEAENVNNLRSRASRLFEKGKLRGIGNILSAEKVVLEVWQRRDNSREDSDINWHNVMADLGLDLLLL